MTEKITPQRVFDAAWQAFVVEGKPPAQEQDPIDGMWECKYLTNDGRRCAYGLLMTESQSVIAGEYNPSMLGAVGIEVDGEPATMDSLQFMLHDQMCEEGDWAADFDTQGKRATHYRKVAAEFGLTVPE